MNIYRNFTHDSLYRNAILLSFDTVLLGLSGFVFWLIGARLYSPYFLGITATLITASSLLASISILGFDNTFTRYLANHKNKSNLFQTGFTLVLIVSSAVGLLFAIIYPRFASELSFLSDSLMQTLLFVLLVVLAAQNTLTNGAFLGFRKAQYILYANMGLIASKLLLPLLFVSITGLGLYLSYFVGMVLGVVASFWMLYRCNSLKPTTRIYKKEIATTWKFSLLSYIGNLLQSVPILLIPLFITATLGASQSAFFYIAMMAANMIFIIPIATSSSLFAEGSNDIHHVFQYAKKALLFNIATLLPLILIIILVGNKFMSVFGSAYANSSGLIFKILAVSALSIAVTNICISILKIFHKLKIVVLINAFGAALLIATIAITAKDSVINVSIAWTISQAITSLAYVYCLWRMRKLFIKTQNKNINNYGKY